jgi:hypothetical protein
MVWVASLAARVDGLPPVTIRSGFNRTSSGREPGQAVILALGIAIFDDDGLPLNIAKLA